MSTIPVILEHGLSADSGGARGISSSAGYSIGYSAYVEKVEKESVTLSISLAVRQQGEAERKFEVKPQVTQGQVTELNPDRQIRIRVHIEPFSESYEENR